MATATVGSRAERQAKALAASRDCNSRRQLSYRRPRVRTAILIVGGNSMVSIRSSIRTALFAVITLCLTTSFTRADSYSWQNFQSDIPGVATHTDPNLVNPWGMSPNSSGTTIWVSDNGTGVSTLYH